MGKVKKVFLITLMIAGVGGFVVYKKGFFIDNKDNNQEMVYRQNATRREAMNNFDIENHLKLKSDIPVQEKSNLSQKNILGQLENEKYRDQDAEKDEKLKAQEKIYLEAIKKFRDDLKDVSEDSLKKEQEELNKILESKNQMELRKPVESIFVDEFGNQWVKKVFDGQVVRYDFLSDANHA